MNVLLTDIRPEKSVLNAMNEINASKRQREAAFDKGEAGGWLVNTTRKRFLLQPLGSIGFHSFPSGSIEFHWTKH